MTTPTPERSQPPAVGSSPASGTAPTTTVPSTTSGRPAAKRRPPSPPWYGGLTIGLLGVMALILLTYTLLDWDWQQRIGYWNYVAVIVLIPISSVLMRRWVPDDSGLTPGGPTVDAGEDADPGSRPAE